MKTLFSDYGLWERFMLWLLIFFACLMFHGCGPKQQLGQGARMSIDIKADNGSTQNVWIGSKSVVVTPNVSIPASTLGLQ